MENKKMFALVCPSYELKNKLRDLQKDNSVEVEQVLTASHFYVGEDMRVNFVITYRAYKEVE